MNVYTGGCHCGAVRYEATSALDKVLTCNCSHCSKKGLLLNFIPAEQFKLLSGEEKLTEYQFNKKHIHHMFCSVCGVQSFSNGMGPGGKATVALNVRCLDGIDIDSLTLTPFNGKDY